MWELWRCLSTAAAMLFLCSTRWPSVAGGEEEMLAAHFMGSSECAQLLMRRNQINATAAMKQASSMLQLPSMLLLGDRTMHNNFDWLELLSKRQAGNNYKFVLQERNCSSCSEFEQLLARNSDDLGGVGVVLWNFGLEALHLRPDQDSAFSSIDAYAGTLLCMARALRAFFPSAQLYYKLTNPICIEKFDSALLLLARKWMNAPQLIFSGDYELQMTRTGADMINHFEKDLEHVDDINITVLNHEAAGSCDCTDDGYQFKPLVPEFWTKFTQRLHHHH